MKNQEHESPKQVPSLLVVALVPPIYILWRVVWANRMPIMDCDEVYNYWEPLHHILHGGGQQTWEYANEYALRTYAYIYPMKWVAENVLIHFSVSSLLLPKWFLLSSRDLATTSLQSPTLDDKTEQFFLLRSFLGASMACCELIWLFSLSHKISVRVAFWTGVLMLFGTGMNHAAAAYLPSSTWIMVWLVCCSLFLHRWNYCFCFLAVTSTLAIGWPFGVVLLVPMGLSILFQGESSLLSATKLLMWTALVTVVMQYAVMWIDAQHYGRWTSATLNIFEYNAAGGGDELYGVEPVSYYVKNLVLNFNVVVPLGVLGMPLLMAVGRGDWTLVSVMLAPLLLWLSITVPRPHKEERFLFPMYPILCFAAAWCVDASIGLMDLVLAKVLRQGKSKIRTGIHAFVAMIACTFSLSRTIALSQYYMAPIAIYTNLARATTTMATMDSSPAPAMQMVCTCGEWYRFPSSFFLPKNTHLGFLRSSFTGQLPQAFSEFGSKPESRHVLQPFNDRNLEQTERYVNMEDCDWVVDLAESECVPPNSTIWARASFLDAGATSGLHRILYIPFWNERAIQSGEIRHLNYVLAKL